MFNDCPVCGTELYLSIPDLWRCGNHNQCGYKVDLFFYEDQYLIDNFIIRRNKVLKDTRIYHQNNTKIIAHAILPFSDFSSKEQILKTIERWKKLEILL